MYNYIYIYIHNIHRYIDKISLTHAPCPVWCHRCGHRNSPNQAVQAALSAVLWAKPQPLSLAD